MRDVDEALHHIVIGVLNNPTMDAATLLILCHAMITQNSDFLKPRLHKHRQNRQAKADYHVQLKRHKAEAANHYSENAHRFVSFGLDLLNGAFRKNKFDIHNPETISRLEPIVNVVGNTLFAEEAHVLERALRAVIALVRCPLVSVDKAAPVLLGQMISILEHTGGTSSELAQSSMRALATMIRDRKSLIIKDDQLAGLVALLSPDLEEVEQQPALFALLRAIVSRNFVVPEVYDTMDRIAEMLVTNQSSGTREVCRSIYLQFLLDYPQGSKRLSTSLEFLAKNSRAYVHESGRTSALELLHAILNKFGTDLLDQYGSLFFMSFTMNIVNDQFSRCREMSAENLKLLISRISTTCRQQLLEMPFLWAKATHQQQLLQTSAQVLGLALEAFSSQSDIDDLGKRTLPVLAEMVERSAQELNASTNISDTAMIDEVDWQVPYHAIQSLARIFKLSPSLLNSGGQGLWREVRNLLLFPHVWVRNASARLLGLLYTSLLYEPPLDDLVDAASKSIIQLQSKLLDETLSLQIVKNLYHICKQFSVHQAEVLGQEAPENAEGEQEEESSEKETAIRDPASDPMHWLFVKTSHRARVSHQTRPSMYSNEGVSL